MFLKSSTLGNESDHKMFHNLDSFTSLNPRDLDILPIIAYREFDTQIALFDSLRREDQKSSNYTQLLQDKMQEGNTYCNFDNSLLTGTSGSPEQGTR